VAHLPWIKIRSYEQLKAQKLALNKLMGPLVVEAHHRLQVQGRMCE
jgi:hypothetical protein